jgi:FkbM family methyltransferase
MIFALPGADERVEVAWRQGELAPEEALRRIAAAMPRHWAGREITATLPPAAAAITLRPFTTDMEALAQVFLRDEYAAPLPREPGFIIDGGANIGLTSLYFALRYPRATIVAVEAERSNFEILRRNTAPFAGITAVHAAIWGRTGRLNVYGPRGDHPARDRNKWGFMVADGSETSFAAGVREQAEKVDEVAGVTIGALLARSGRGHIDLLKLDIEGAEREVFTSEERHAWLGSVGVIMIETHDGQKDGCSEAFFAAIRGRTYRQSSRGDVTIVELEA